MKQNRGFTLIELMIVVAIMGLLAAIAIPSYQDYLTRAKISEAIYSMKSARTSISEYYSTQGSMPPSAALAGYSTNIGSKYVRSIIYTRVSASVAQILARITGTVGGGTSANQTVGMQAFGNAARVEWDCYSDTIPLRYIPANCRDAAGGTYD